MKLGGFTERIFTWNLSLKLLDSQSQVSFLGGIEMV